MDCACCGRELEERASVRLRAGSLEGDFCVACAEAVRGIGRESAVLLERAIETALERRPAVRDVLRLTGAVFRHLATEGGRA